MNLRSVSGISLLFVAGLASTASAHVGISSGPVVANKTSIVSFSVGHGCAGSDTYSVTVEIPTGVTSVRGLRSDFGPPVLTRDPVTPAIVTAVTWTKPIVDALPADDGYYDLNVRLKTPDRPFVKVFFKVHQTCRTSDGTILPVVDWAALPGEAGNEAPAVVVLPDRKPGWNRYTIAETLLDADLATTWFADAQILWRGVSAWSPNPNTTATIATTPGVTPLADGLAPTQEIWVKY